MMCISEKNKTTSNPISVYSPPDCEEMNKRIDGIVETWETFLNNEGEKSTQFFIHKYNLFQVVKRLDQRMYYYKVFHELEYPCEYKYTAILCFWILTLKPFVILDENSNLYDCPNERFCLYLILTLVRCLHKIYHPDESFVYPSPDRIRDILYDFKYCSLSREAMISFVETFSDNYKIGIEFILNNKDLIKERTKEISLSNLPWLK